MLTSNLSDVLWIEYGYLFYVQYGLCYIVKFNPVETAMVRVGLNANNDPVEPIGVEVNLNAVTDVIFI